MALGHRDLRDIVGSAGSGLRGIIVQLRIRYHSPLTGGSADLIEDSEAIQPGEAVSITLLQEQRHSVLGILSEREAGVVSMRFWADRRPAQDPRTRSARSTGSPGAIRQIVSKAMSKQRQPSRSNLLRNYLD